MQQIFIPDASTTGTVTYQVVVGGQVANPTYELQSMVITRETNRIPSARLSFKDGDPSQKTFAMSEQSPFIPGASIVLQLGRGGNNTQAFKGIVIRHAIRVKENGQSELTLDCRDETIRMTVGRHSKYFLKVFDSDVMNTLVSGYPDLTCTVNPTTLKFEELVQNHMTDWDFLLLRAEANGMLVNVVDGTVQISAPTTNNPSALTVAFGSSVLEFEAEMDARNQWNNVEARSWDFHSQQLFQADVSSVSNWQEAGNIPGATLAQTIKLQNYELHHSGYLTELELNNWATGQMARSALAKICGRAKCDGFANINPGNMLTVTGVGARFNGNVYTTAVRHEVGNGMWDTHVQFGLNARRYAELFADIDDRAAAGLSGGIRGLQIGVCAQLDGDPDGQGRILVRLPIIDNTNVKNGVWTRVASLDAGNNRGSFFMPEVNDEVIVGFINDDPRQAVLLGMVNSSALPAAWQPSTANNIKGFQSRSKMQFTFDDGQLQLTLTTKNGNQIQFDDKAESITMQDQNQNMIQMNSQGITLSSGTGTITIQAPNISLNGTTGITATTPSATISATGPLTMSGAPVAIN
jgi:Rhs element Vgr protein